MIHLWGGAGEVYVRRGLRLLMGKRAQDHDPRVYLARGIEMQAVCRIGG